MSGLDLAPKLSGHDGIYQALIDMQEGATEADSLRACVRLILILANQIGDQETVLAAIDLARPPNRTS